METNLILKKVGGGEKGADVKKFANWSGKATLGEGTAIGGLQEICGNITENNGKLWKIDIGVWIFLMEGSLKDHLFCMFFISHF